MKQVIILFTAVLMTGFLTSCKKKADEPPLKNLASGTIHTAEQLKSIASCTNSCQKRFTGDDYFIGVVIADEQFGNFYKELYVRDRNGKGAIHLDLLASNSGFFVGDSVRLALKGYDIGLNADSGMLEVDSIDHEKSITRFGHGPAPSPIVIKLSDLSGTNPYTNYLCDLITIEGVGFIPADTNKFYADYIGQSSTNRTIQDCQGNQIIVRTSNYANFASQKTPKGFGSITGIATAYQGTNQMAIRNNKEVNMNGTGCTIYHKKDFNDNSLSSGGWNSVSVTNTAVAWTASTFSGAYFAKISGFVGGSNTNSECWMISPALDLSASVNPILNFQTAAKFSGTALELWVSTNYTNGAPGTGTWTQITGFTLSPNTGNYVWTPSGTISLSNYKSAGVRLAFKYKSTTSGSTTYEVDDIIVREN